MAYFIHGKRVSKYWHRILTAAIKAGVDFEITSGQRTMGEQTALYRNPPPGTPLVARPTPWAPHIRLGRQDHAIDFNALDGSVDRIARWLRAHGCRVTHPVPGEPWHTEVPAADLKRLYNALADPFAAYPADERRWIAEYDALKRAKRDKDRRAVLRRYMKARRKDIFRAATKRGGGGWGRLSRPKRYASLLARSR